MQCLKREMLSAEDESMSVDSHANSADSNYSVGRGAEPQLMSMGIYKVNLGTRFGQRMHSLHMLILPLIPIFILLVQNGIKYGTYVLEADEILSVQRQVRVEVDPTFLLETLDNVLRFRVLKSPERGDT